jgi:UDP-N-acetylglucosamine 4,6-dehydratase/5-epimerase
MIEGSVVLLTGGTGSFGQAATQAMLKLNPRVIRIFSRHENLQSEMRKQFNDERLRFLIGDVRERERLVTAMSGVDYVLHAAALKEVDTCQGNPDEAVKTNIMGSINVRDAAIECKVKKVIGLSTDKACDAFNLYGHTKAIMEAEMVWASRPTGTRLSCTRYGNVIGSRGSVVKLWREQAKTGTITITDPDMTRFWLPIDRGVEFVLNCLGQMAGGEIFIPKVPSMRLGDLATVVAPGAEWNIIGLRPGEKLHEVLLSKNESHMAREFPTAYVVKDGLECNLPPQFEYASNSNTEWLSEDDMRRLV